MCDLIPNLIVTILCAINLVLMIQKARIDEKCRKQYKEMEEELKKWKKWKL
jgi:hypothetical protein